jgi:mycothiol synthase
VGLAHLKERGATVCGLYVDEDNVRAVQLYQSLGFTRHHTDVSFSLDL